MGVLGLSLGGILGVQDMFAWTSIGTPGQSGCTRTCLPGHPRQACGSTSSLVILGELRIVLGSTGHGWEP